ncbi:MAG: zinc ribbon domain-containing protein, partial [Intestinibacter sp.]
GNFSKVFNVQNKKFVTISCKNCGYTELYKAQTSTGMNVLDFLIG